jgi:hypothetical protein
MQSTPEFTFLQTSLNRYTFRVKGIRLWVENQCQGKTVLNLFGGPTRLNGCIETSNDLAYEAKLKSGQRLKIETTFHMDALDCVRMLIAQGKKYQRVVLDPPYSIRKSMEMYKGNLNSRFKQICDLLPLILEPDGRVITFGYHSIVMGEERGFRVVEICLISHGGAMRSTIAAVEGKLEGDTIVSVETPINRALSTFDAI